MKRLVTWSDVAVMAGAGLLVRRLMSTGGSATSAAPTSGIPQSSVAGRQDGKHARVFIMELNRWRTEYKKAPSAAARIQLLRNIDACPLQSVVGLDAKLLSNYLSVLSVVGVPPLDRKLQSAASWLCAHHDQVACPVVIDILHWLRTLRYEDLPFVIESVSPTLQRFLQTLSSSDDADNTSVLARAVDVIMFACCKAGTTTPLAMQFFEQLRGALYSMSSVDCIAVLTTLASGVGFVKETPLLQQLAEDLIQRLETSAEVSAFTIEDRVNSFAALVRLGRMPHKIAVSICNAEVDVAHTPPLLIPLLRVYTVATKGDKGIRDATASVYDMVERLCIVLSPRALSMEAFCELFAAATSADTQRFIPAAWNSAIAETVEASSSWSCETVGLLVAALHEHPSLRALITTIAAHRITELKQATAVGDVIAPSSSVGGGTQLHRPVASQDLVVLMTSSTVEKFENDLSEMAGFSIESWCPASVHLYLATLSTIQTRSSRRLQREAAPRLIGLVARLTPSQLANIAACYGRSHVRHDGFCDELSNRAISLGRELSIHHIAIILGALASVEYRVNKAFLDLAPLVLTRCREASASQVFNLIVSYAKLLVWNFKLFATLAQRAFEVKEHFDAVQMIAILTAFCRMDFTHDDLTLYFLEKLQKDVKCLQLFDAVQVAVSFSQTSVRNAELFEELADRFISEQQRLDASLLGEVLLAYARVFGEGLSSKPSSMGHRIFDALALRSLALAPQCPPLSMAHIAQAYALVGVQQAELFAVFSERLRTGREEFPAVIIGAILNAFAKLGVKDDRLFIEMIPRVRHVGQFGGPKDVANVVSAYSGIGLWHYKLFARLADRAVQIRGECRPREIVQILAAYGKVQMRYDKLFVELSPRIQTLSHLLQPHEIAKIFKAYAAVDAFESGLFNVLADRVVEMADAFSVEDLQTVADSVERYPSRHEQLDLVLKGKLARSFSESESIVGNVDAEAAHTTKE